MYRLNRSAANTIQQLVLPRSGQIHFVLSCPCRIKSKYDHIFSSRILTILSAAFPFQRGGIRYSQRSVPPIHVPGSVRITPTFPSVRCEGWDVAESETTLLDALSPVLLTAMTWCSQSLPSCIFAACKPWAFGFLRRIAASRFHYSNHVKKWRKNIGTLCFENPYPFSSREPLVVGTYVERVLLKRLSEIVKVQ